MDRMIRYQLEIIGKRLRSQVFAWLLIAFWLVILGSLVMKIRQNMAAGGEILSINYLVGMLVAVIGISALWSRYGYRDLIRIAQRIERRHPDLDQKLLTSAEPAKAGESDFLRKKLIDETLRHAKQNQWEQIVPGGRLVALWSLQWLLLLAIAITSILYNKPGSTNSVPGSAQSKLTDWVIEPGDTEIEKGTDLLISVRFPEGFTEKITLNMEMAGGELQSIDLQRALRDPVASATLRRVKQPLRYSVQSASKKSQDFAVDVFEHPAVLQSDATIQSPAYANQDEKTIANTRRVSIVDGANVQWRLKLNKSVATAQWIDEADQVTLLNPSPGDPTEFEIPGSPRGSGRYRLKLIDHQGRSEKVSEEFVVKVIPNREPEMKLTSATDQRVSPIEEMIVGAKVQDDFGIHRAGITVSIGDEEPIEIVLADSDKDSQKKADFQHLIDLEALRAKADQLVTYHFWSEDLDREGQARRVDSEIYFAEVRPFEEFFREGDASATEQRQQQQQQQQQGSQGAQQAEELAELQKKIIAATWNLIRTNANPREDQSESVAEKINVIQQSQQQAIQQSETLKENLQNPDSQQDLIKVQASMQQAVDELGNTQPKSPSIGLRDAMKSMRVAYEGLLRLRAREHEVTQNQQQQSNQRSQSASQRNRQQQLEQLQLERDPNPYEEESQPMQEEPQAEREMRQVMNRLDELARRQSDLNQQVRELDLALQATEDQQEKRELQERLDRLREEQQQLVQDADELLERMNNPETRNALEESRDQVENARQQMQKSEEELRKAEPSAALNSGTRAQQQVEETRQKLREQSSEALQRDVQDLVQQAQKVVENQSRLERNLQQQTGQTSQGSTEGPEARSSENQPRESLLRNEAEFTRDPEAERENLEAWKDQKKEYGELLDRIKQTVEQAEGSEPLLAEQLYETYREASRQPTEQRLDRIPMMIERGMDQPAIEESQEVTRELQGLKDRIEQSSESVLGSEEESLKRALKELERANQEIQDELMLRGGNDSEARRSSSNSDTPAANRERADGENQESQTRNGPQTNPERSDGQQPNSQQPNGQQPNSQQPNGQQPNGQQPNGQQPNGQQPNGQQPNGQQPSGQQPNGQQPNSQQQDFRQSTSERGAGAGQPRSVLEELEARISRGGAGSGIETRSPLMGEDYAQWTDRLRDIEELVRDPELRAEAARVREAARDFRMEYKRHAKEPEWDLVKKMISNPLQELQRKVREELVRKAAKQNELVPLDRDPVPEKFRSELDRYFERLGGEQTK